MISSGQKTNMRSKILTAKEAKKLREVREEDSKNFAAHYPKRLLAGRRNAPMKSSNSCNENGLRRMGEPVMKA
jgi:hypothetical protein